MEHADRIAAAAHTGNDGVGEAAGAGLWVEQLVDRLTADHALKIAHHGRIGMRAQGAAEQVVGRAHIGDPVADGLVDGILERLAPRFDPTHLCAQQLHTIDVGLLADHIDGAHVDDALDAKHGGGSSRSHAVLAGARLGDDARLVHLALHQQRLAQRVVDLVGAGVGQVFALDVNMGAAEILGEPPGIRDRRRPTDEGAEQVGKLCLEVLVVL